MKIQLWPRSIGLQLLAGLLLLEVLSLGLFAAILLRQQSKSIQLRAEQRLQHQATSLSIQVVEGLQSDYPKRAVATSVRIMADAPSVASALVTDASGAILYSSPEGSHGPQLDQEERKELLQILARGSQNQAQVFVSGSGDREGVKSIGLRGNLYGYAWVRTDRQWDEEQVIATMQTTAVFAFIWIGASMLLAWALGRSISRPLAVLRRGTRALMHSPEGVELFPLPVTVQNEVGELIEAFNRMVASLEEQRDGLSDTLALLDSMLANAPIGLVFFDDQSRLVRVNRIFAEATGLPLSSHPGRTLPDVLPASVSRTIEELVQSVFRQDAPVRDVEVTVTVEGAPRPWTWIVNAYPIHTASNQVRWVGLIIMDASERKRAEETLRKTEKLAATGRLAASIAHEINNPLEAITNLLYLLSHHPDLDETARAYTEMAENEIHRISEITQQTLRFYRQSTLPSRANLGELLDSVLRLHQGRLRNLEIEVEREYDPTIDLYCFAGELRQVFANLVGNAIDAMPQGGRLSIRARRSQDWGDHARPGVRFQVSDTGSGMKPGVEKRIFEPFFTTKEVTGTGLGLWVSWEIVAKHQGSIRVRSRAAGQTKASGTVFELFFPDGAELVLGPDAADPASSVDAK